MTFFKAYIAISSSRANISKKMVCCTCSYISIYSEIDEEDMDSLLLHEVDFAYQKCIIKIIMLIPWEYYTFTKNTRIVNEGCPEFNKNS